MSDIHALSGAYAIDAVDDIERVSFERHLAGCAVCRAEVASLREATAAMADDASTAPPPELRAAVLAGVAQVRPLPPLVAPGGPVHRRKWFPALVAAVVITLVGVGGVVWQPWRDDSSQTVSVADQVLADPAAQRFEQDLPTGGTVTLVRSARLHRAVVVAKEMPAAPSGKAYQLWLQSPEEEMVPAGLMEPGQSTALLVGDADAAIGAGITVEPAGGSEHPTTDPVALFDFQQA